MLRARLDGWLARQCERVGVTAPPRVLVDSLVTGGGSIVGIWAGGDELRAHVVVATDGINSFLCRNAGIRDKEPARNLALSVKSVTALPRTVIEDPFGPTGEEGAAYAVVGDCTQGLGGGGLLYTNRESVQAGIVVRLDELSRSASSSSDLHDCFLSHPAISPLLRGEPVEYRCHLIAEGGRAIAHDLTRPGWSASATRPA